MKIIKYALVLVLTYVTIAVAGGSNAPAEERQLSWKVNPPIVTIEKSVFIECKTPKEAAGCGLDYIRPKLEMYLMKGVEGSSDVHTQVGLQFSGDNSRTWSAPKTLPDSLHRYQGIEASKTPFPGPLKYDPRSKMLIGFKLRQLAASQRYYHSTCYMLSADPGRTWTEPKQLQYEPGVSFDPENPLKPGYIENNQAEQHRRSAKHGGTRSAARCLQTEIRSHFLEHRRLVATPGFLILLFRLIQRHQHRQSPWPFRPRNAHEDGQNNPFVPPAVRGQCVCGPNRIPMAALSADLHPTMFIDGIITCQINGPFRTKRFDNQRGQNSCDTPMPKLCL